MNDYASANIREPPPPAPTSDVTAGRFKFAHTWVVEYAYPCVSLKTSTNGEFDVTTSRSNREWTVVVIDNEEWSSPKSLYGLMLTIHESQPENGLPTRINGLAFSRWEEQYRLFFRTKY